jgi:hypothetical protein
MAAWNTMTVWQNGQVSVQPQGINQPVNGSGRYQVPRGFGSQVRLMMLQSAQGSQGPIWSVNWETPWLGNPLGGL